MAISSSRSEPEVVPSTHIGCFFMFFLHILSLVLFCAHMCFNRRLARGVCICSPWIPLDYRKPLASVECTVLPSFLRSFVLPSFLPHLVSWALIPFSFFLLPLLFFFLPFATGAETQPGDLRGNLFLDHSAFPLLSPLTSAQTSVLAPPSGWRHPPSGWRSPQGRVCVEPWVR